MNLNKALLCSIGYLFVLIAVSSAQNCQNKLFSVDNYGNLGFYSNAVVQFGQVIGNLIGVYICNKIGNAKTIAYS